MCEPRGCQSKMVAIVIVLSFSRLEIQGGKCKAPRCVRTSGHKLFPASKNGWPIRGRFSRDVIVARYLETSKRPRRFSRLVNCQQSLSCNHGKKSLRACVGFCD